MPRSAGPAPSRIVGSATVTELALTAFETLWVFGGLVSAGEVMAVPLAPTPAVITLAVALWLASLLRLTYITRGSARMLAARQRQEAVPPGEADRAQHALGRFPFESGGLRFASWLAVCGAALALGVPPTTQRPALAMAALASTAVVHAAGAGALRALFLGEITGPWRAALAPTLEAMRVFSRSYRSWLCLLAVAVLGLAHLELSLLAGSLPNLRPGQRAALLLLMWPVLLPGLLLWVRSLWRRSHPIEAYFDVTLRSPGTRGPARDEPKAVTAFTSAQSLPYRLGGYHGFVLLLAGVAAIAASRRMLSLPLRAAIYLLFTLAVVVALATLYQVLLARHVLRPLMRHLGSRHALPVTEIRSRFGLRPKLTAVFAVIGGSTAALASLGIAAPIGRAGWAAAGVLLGLSAVVGLVWLVGREVVLPLAALESRSEEMARGELARPLPPSGEADEIGRLAVVFEEMRRALRDKLRSTESINIDLEREVRRRTEALEQRNTELREALEKLKRAQDNLVRSEKLASMGRLVAGIAHEINNPVNAVINSLGPLEDVIAQIKDTKAATAAELAADAEQMVAVIQRGAVRTKAIVQALHNYSRGDDSVPKEINLARSVEDSLDLLRHRLRNVKVIKEVEPDTRIMGLGGQIDQVLMNLMTNAVQAMGENGGTLRVGARPRADGVEAWVADDGPGIPPEVLPRIFDPFFTTKDVGEGSGLGLSIVHGIVDRHGGRIDVETEVGQGTRFRLWFPHPRVGAARARPSS